MKGSIEIYSLFYLSLFMARETIDPGLGVKFESKSYRIINKDGSFNVKRKGAGFSTWSMYQDLITMSWSRFFLITVLFILLVNILFAFAYLAFGIENVAVPKSRIAQDFLNALFFSFQTFTTVGYGHISPIGNIVSAVAAIEAVIGFMCFALATGLLYGRFSRPNTKIIYSENVLVSPYKDGWAVMFKIANGRRSKIINLKAVVTLIVQEISERGERRRYFELPLERSQIQFFPLTWTIVHPIDEQSPFGKYDLSSPDLHFELMILLEGFDETFAQTVHSMTSYRKQEFVTGAKFKKSFEQNEQHTLLNLDEISEYVKVEYPG